MKRLALLLLCAAPALADDDVVARTRNESGGEIVFTVRETTACKGHGFEAYATDGKGNLLTGCWRIVDDYFVLVYSDGDQRAYKASSLQFSNWVSEGNKGHKL